MPMAPRHLLIILLALNAILLAGCGDRRPATPQQRMTTGKITLKWPPRGRLIPVAANSVKVEIREMVGESYTDFLAVRVLNRPTEGGLSTATFDRLPVGSLLVTATAYPDTDAGGVAQATANILDTAIYGSTFVAVLTMASTITQVEVTPGTKKIAVGDTVQLTATPKNDGGEVVLTAPGNITWSTLDMETASVDGNGLVTGNMNGSTTITALETESGISGTAGVQAIGPIPAGTVAGEVSINPWDGAEMVWVPAGLFTMGTSDADVQSLITTNGTNWFNNEKPQHSVYLDGYWIYKYEVTYAQYNAYCQDAGQSLPAAPFWGWQDTHPIVNVDWNAAVAYANWAHATLPTEAQWEKAARGDADDRPYPWGWEYASTYLATWANSNTTGVGTGTHSVGSFIDGASPYGAMDMLGNAWEWCADWYQSDYYLITPTANPTGPTTGTDKVLRGDSWYSYGGVIDYAHRCPYRVYAAPSFTYNDYGFRCAIAIYGGGAPTGGTGDITVQ